MDNGTDKFKCVIWKRGEDMRNLAVTKKVDDDLFPVKLNAIFTQFGKDISEHYSDFDSPNVLERLKGTMNYEGFSSIEPTWRCPLPWIWTTATSFNALSNSLQRTWGLWDDNCPTIFQNTPCFIWPIKPSREFRKLWKMRPLEKRLPWFINLKNYELKAATNRNFWRISTRHRRFWRRFEPTTDFETYPPTRNIRLQLT